MKKIVLILFTLSLSLYAQEDSFYFEDEGTYEEDSGLSLEFGGRTDINGHLNPNYDQLEDSDKGINAAVDLDISLHTELVDISGNIDLEIQDYDNLDEFPLQSQPYTASAFIDTLFIRYYDTYFDLEIGLLKPVWGNADGVHVIDVLNPLDYSEPFGPSYLNKKISQQMIKINIPLGDNSLLEAAYLPKFEGDNISLTGKWQPYYLKTMEDTIYSMALGAAMAQAKAENPEATEAMLFSAVESIARAKASAIAATLSLEDSEYFVDSQAAVRFSTSIESVDFGFIYYWGFLKQPTIDPEDVLKTGKLNLIYNRVHTIGSDIAAQLGMFNIKGEISYSYTDDFKGDNGAIKNNTLNYILGFDINLPLNNLNLLLQGVGSTLINSGEITALDPEYRKDSEYTDLMIMARVSDNYLNETLFLEVSAAFDILNHDSMLTPKGEYKINDNFLIYLEYLLLNGDKDTDFGQYRDNDTITLGLEYFF